MYREIKGSFDGKNLNVGIVVARFNKFVTEKLLAGALSALTTHGVEEQNITVVWVPGSFEIPLIASEMGKSGNYAAIICLGAIIKGETDHYYHIAAQSAEGLAKAGFTSGVPVTFGVLTTNTVEQAIDRTGGYNGIDLEKPISTNKSKNKDDLTSDNKGNAGYHAALCAIEMANLIGMLRNR